MTITRTFPVDEGINGMNRLALCLDAADLAGQWHFAAGIRCDQTSVDIGFDSAEDAELAWQGHKDGGLAGNGPSVGPAPAGTAPRRG